LVRPKYEQSITINKKHLPSDQFDLGMSFSNIGNAHDRLGHYDIALEYYNQALDIYSNLDRPKQQLIELVQQKINKLYKDKNQFEQITA
jgi:tetratricopeptide (TPR) repeat protein